MIWISRKKFMLVYGSTFTTLDKILIDKRPQVQRFESSLESVIGYSIQNDTCPNAAKYSPQDEVLNPRQVWDRGAWVVIREPILYRGWSWGKYFIL